MNIKIIISTFVLLTLLMSCKSNDVKLIPLYTLEAKEINGIKEYQRGNHKQAFDLLKEPASFGYKGSQYTLGFMFLKGQHVQQSTLLGMGWLGVAIEANVKEWQEQYNTFYSAASTTQKKQIDKIVQKYIEQYGLKSQHVTCTKEINTSKRLDVKCHKYEDASIVYPVETVEQYMPNRP